MADYGSLEGGWGHVASDPLAFIQELLTPRNVQGSTSFAGGSHYGPGREMSIPQENFAQVAELLKMLSARDQYQRGSEITGQADDLMRRRLEAERTNLSPGSITMGGVTEVVPGKMGVQTDLTPTEVAMTEAGGYADTRYPPKGYGSASAGGKTGPDYGDITDRAEFVQKMIDSDRTMLASLDPKSEEYASVQSRLQENQVILKGLVAGGQSGGRVDEPNNGDLVATTDEFVRPGQRTRTLEETLGYRPAWMDEPRQSEPSTIAPASTGTVQSSPEASTTSGLSGGEQMMANYDPNSKFDIPTTPLRNESEMPWTQRGGMRHVGPALQDAASFLAGVGGKIKGDFQGAKEVARMQKEGIDPLTGQPISPDDPKFELVDPKNRAAALQRWAEFKGQVSAEENQMASAIGYQPYQSAGG